MTPWSNVTRRSEPKRRRAAWLTVAAVYCTTSFTGVARGQATTETTAGNTPGYQEKVFQWTVQPNETCPEIAESVYGQRRFAYLLKRYNHIDCDGELEPGTTLVVPATPTELPAASLRAISPTVKARPPGETWTNARQGMPLHPRYSVNTLDDANADIQFRDRSRIYMGEHTLVVIYGTADETKVAKNPPPEVELQAGELFAGLAALRGKPVEVKLQDGGEVLASSRDAVLRKHGQRTTVSVFDGKAQVRSAGQSVQVAKNFGSAVEAEKPPTPPKELPPAPAWDATSSTGLVVSAPGSGVLRAAWSKVDEAVAYRFELARDARFEGLVVREEVPAKVRSFRAENLPPGEYHLRVRAVDAEDFLGVASVTRSASVWQVAAPGATVQDDQIEVSPYAALTLTQDPGLELAVDGGPFESIPETLDLQLLSPKQFQLRRRGEPTTYPVRLAYQPTSATVSVAQTSPTEHKVTVEFHGTDGIDVASLVKPRLDVKVDGSSTFFALTPTDTRQRFVARLDITKPGRTTLAVVDHRGRKLGGAVADVEWQGKPPPTPPQPFGVTLFPNTPSSFASVDAWGPAVGAYGFASVVATRSDDLTSAQGRLRAGTSLGRLLLDASASSYQLADDRELSPGVPVPQARVDSSYRLGAGYRFVGSADVVAAQSGLAVGARGSVVLPAAEDSPPQRLEASVAASFGDRPWFFRSNLGARFRVGDQRTSNPTPNLHGFLLMGAGFHATDWLTAYALADGHWFNPPGASQSRGRGGLFVGLEAGTSVFANLGLRGSPWGEDTGHLVGSFGLGLRDWD